MISEVNNDIYHSIIIDTTLHEIVINPVKKYSYEYFYYIFCCCFIDTNNDNITYIHV